MPSSVRYLAIAAAVFLLGAPGSVRSGNVYYYEDAEGTLYLADEPPAVKQYGVLRNYASNAIRFAAARIPRNDLRRLIAEMSGYHGLEPALVEAVVKTESDYDTMAVSSKGAQGLMQLMPQTAGELGVRNPHDPRENLEGGIRHLKRLLDRYGGDLDRAAAAYNAGETSVARFNGIPPYPETVDYVKKVRKYYETLRERALRSASTDGFTRPETLAP